MIYILPQGLSSAAAKARLAEDGPNALTPTGESSWWGELLRTMVAGFAMLLWLGCLICFVAYGIEVSSDEDASRDNVRAYSIRICLL